VPYAKAGKVGAQYAQHQPPAEFARQVAEDKIFFAVLLKELDIKLE